MRHTQSQARPPRLPSLAHVNLMESNGILLARYPAEAFTSRPRITPRLSRTRSTHTRRHYATHASLCLPMAPSTRSHPLSLRADGLGARFMFMVHICVASRLFSRALLTPSSRSRHALFTSAWGQGRGPRGPHLHLTHRPQQAHCCPPWARARTRRSLGRA
jgi:hypothetical protein